MVTDSEELDGLGTASVDVVAALPNTKPPPEGTVVFDAA